MKSIPVAAKVGTAGVLGGGGIVGTGLFIHEQMKFKLTGLDLELVNDSQASLAIETSGEKFSVGSNGENNQVTLKIKTTSSIANSTFHSGTKWTCEIKGIAKGDNKENIPLTVDDNSGNFKQQEQTDKFKNRLSKDKLGFVTSCARNRTEVQKKDVGTLTSEIRVELTKAKGEPDPGKYEFSQEAIDSIFAGTWDNEKQK